MAGILPTQAAIPSFSGVTNSESALGRSQAAGKAGSAQGFGDLVAKGVSEVSDSINSYQGMSDKLAHGESINVHELMLRGEQADMSLKMMVTLRNKVVEAYQDVMRLAV